ncbi:MAG: DUF4317 domain-containing protein [Blautia sp.]|jgi:hypothetical protein
MIKKEILEIRKLFTPSKCNLTRICGCYVDAEKNKRTELKEAFLSIPEEEAFKYFDIFRKSLSGSLGKNLLNMEFPLHQEEAGGTQEFLMRLRNSKLQDDELLEEFYDKIIENYIYGENYYIIVVHGAYDLPKRASDGTDMWDAGEDVYNYIFCSICPVNLSKAGLCYNAQTNTIEDRTRDWIVETPDLGFLFPAFNDRNTDIHGLLYYSKNPEQLQSELIDQMLGCTQPLSAKGQKETFNVLIEETLGDNCDYESVRGIHDQLNELMTVNQDAPVPLELDKTEVKKLLADHGATEEGLEMMEHFYDDSVGEKASLLAANVINTRKFEIKTPDVVVQVNPERTDLVETKTIGDKNYLVIEINDRVEVNGISVRAARLQTDTEDAVE